MRRPQLKFSPYLVPSLFSIVWLPWYQLQWRTQVCQNQQPGITQPLQKPEAIEVLFIIEFYLALTRKYFLLGKDKFYACIIFTDPPALRGLTLTCSTMLSSWTVPTTGILSRTNWTLLKEKRTSPGTQTTSSCSSTELSPPPPILVSPCVCSAYTVHRQWLHFHQTLSLTLPQILSKKKRLSVWSSLSLYFGNLWLVCLRWSINFLRSHCIDQQILKK